MPTAILYTSRHGRTRQVVATVAERLSPPPKVINLTEPATARPWAEHDRFQIFCPTYGDEELEPSMEECLVRHGDDLAGCDFAVCELGNYYGYDDFSFGALHILRRHLLTRGGRELCSPLSLDSLPRLDWPQLDRWIDHVKTALKSHE